MLSFERKCKTYAQSSRLAPMAIVGSETQSTNGPDVTSKHRSFGSQVSQQSIECVLTRSARICNNAAVVRWMLGPYKKTWARLFNPCSKRRKAHLMPNQLSQHSYWWCLMRDQTNSKSFDHLDQKLYQYVKQGILNVRLLGHQLEALNPARWEDGPQNLGESRLLKHHRPRQLRRWRLGPICHDETCCCWLANVVKQGVDATSLLQKSLSMAFPGGSREEMQFNVAPAQILRLVV